MSLRYCFACSTTHQQDERCPKRKAWSGRRVQTTRARIARRDGMTCQECGAPLTMATMRADHKTPRAMGGNTWDDGNLQALCTACNDAKGNG